MMPGILVFILAHVCSFHSVSDVSFCGEIGSWLVGIEVIER